MEEDYKLPIVTRKAKASFLDKMKSAVSWAAKKDLLDYVPFRLVSKDKTEYIPLNQFERNYGVGDKLADIEDFGMKRTSIPFYERSWFKNTMFWGRRAVFLSSAAACAALLNYSNENRADAATQFASQKAGLEEYLESPQFDLFAKEIEKRSLWTINFIAKEPVTAHQILPEVAKAEEKSGDLDWSLYVRPISQSDYSPAKIVEKQRNIFSLLSSRGYKLDAASRIEGKKIIFNQAIPSMNAYLKEKPSNQFPLIVKSPELQEVFMRAVAKRFNSANQYDVERLGKLYGLFGSAMYEDQRAIAAKSRNTFTVSK
ncbi:MAG TPA: hypothetical protein VHA12_00050 [Candidatus Nanoarchaeia archaeon]|nr:hypothetical protein [Candidatus Nanoarchaeia archaeon]